MISALAFFGILNWIDGSPLQIEPYRQDLFRKALDTYRDDGVPEFTMVLAGRGKKNNKSLDLILAGLYCLLFREDARGSDALIIANDEDQAGQDLDLCKKLIAANPDLDEELTCLSDEIRRKDGKGTMRVLPANNVVGQHGKTAAFLGFDEIHGYKDHALFEALAPDPPATASLGSRPTIRSSMTKVRRSTIIRRSGWRAVTRACSLAGIPGSIAVTPLSPACLRRSVPIPR